MLCGCSRCRLSWTKRSLSTELEETMSTELEETVSTELEESDTERPPPPPRPWPPAGTIDVEARSVDDDWRSEMFK